MGLEQNLRVTEYLDQICTQIKCQQVHTQVRLELLSHIEEAVDRKLAENTIGELFVHESCPEIKQQALDQAVEASLAELGDPVAVGKKLHRTHKPRTEWGLIFTVGIMCILGLATLFTLQRLDLRGVPSGIAPKTILWLSAGGLIAWIVRYVDYRRKDILGSSFKKTI